MMSQQVEATVFIPTEWQEEVNEGQRWLKYHLNLRTISKNREKLLCD